ncbi:ABC transporter ATP-binding protein/permease [Flavobacteriales bacterium]|nr:ABC transporter ATP-binding protein/permease [Flavobacteriales bacterium]
MRELLKLNPYFKKYPLLLLGGVIFIFFTNVFAVFAPALIGEGVNALRDADEIFLDPLRSGMAEADVFEAAPEISYPGTLSKLQSWSGALLEAPKKADSKQDVLHWMGRIAALQALLFLIAYLIKGTFLFFTRQTIIVMSRRIEFDLKGKIFDQYQRLDAAFYRANDTGDLMNRISEDVSKVRMYLGPAIMYTINLAMLIILVVSVMVYIDWKLTLFALLPLPLMSLAIYFVSTRINVQSEAVQKKQSGLSTFVQQHIAGIRVLKSFQREKDASQRFAGIADDYKNSVLRLVKTEALFMPIIVLLVGLSTILTVYVGGLRVISGELEVGHIFQFVFYVNLLTWPFASVGWVTSLVQKAEASMRRINAFMEAEPAIQAPDELAKGLEPSTKSGLKFDRVSFTYPETGIEAVKNLSFQLIPGKILAVTGRTGSGKSTVAQLAMRIFDPHEGQIAFDGIPLQQWPLNEFRSETGYVPQDVFLFSDTIQRNIAFGLPEEDSTRREVQSAAEQAHVAHNIEGFEQEYETLLGERGVNLSGGQKQRISIARALIRKPKLLILDDCLSAVDTETEEAILQSIRNQGDSTAVLMVSHRISSIRGADHVVVLDQGKLIEEGTPEELAQADGVYARMVQQQVNRNNTSA